MDHRAQLQCNASGTLENQMRALTIVHATAAVLAIRLRLPQSFPEKSRQFVGIWPIKKALESAFEVSCCIRS
jgi:hypothetical protein